MSPRPEFMDQPSFLIESSKGVVTITLLNHVSSSRPQEVEPIWELIVKEMQDQSWTKLIIDLQKLHHCGSGDLVLLLRLWKNVAALSGRFVLCNLTPQVAELLTHTKLNTIWPCYPSPEAARAELEKS